MSRKQQNKLVMILLAAQGRMCGSCGGRIPTPEPCVPPRLRATIDHVIPRSRGGASHISNYLLLHQECNVRKSDRMPNGCELIVQMMVHARTKTKPHQVSPAGLLVSERHLTNF